MRIGVASVNPHVALGCKNKLLGFEQLKSALELFGSRVAMLQSIIDPYCKTACLWLSAFAVSVCPRDSYRQELYTGQLSLAVASNVAYQLVLVALLHASSRLFVQSVCVCPALRMDTLLFIFYSLLRTVLCGSHARRLAVKPAVVLQLC